MRPHVAGFLSAVALGCASPPPIQQLTFATTEPNAVGPRLLREDVEGIYCFSRNAIRVLLTPPWRTRRANHGYAVAAALDAVPGANVLTDVRMSVEVQQYVLFQRVCAIATGDAGVLE